MEKLHCELLYLCILVGFQFCLCVNIRGKLTDLDIFFEKEGECPTNDMVSSFVNGICEKECYLDLDCMEREKCCQNTCGGTSCQLPHQFVDQCQNFECSNQGQTCKVLDGQPSCVCISNCTDTNESVCADDGQVYPSRCWMDVAACEEGIQINVIPCTETIQPVTEEGVPSMLIQSTVFTADEHQDATLFCDAVSQSTVSYAWIVNQPGVNMAVLLPGQTLDNLRVSFDGKVLLITSVDTEDEGTYGCLASNTFGLSTVSHKLIVIAQETPVVTTESTVRPLNNSKPQSTEEPSNPTEGIHGTNGEVAVNLPMNEVCVETLDRGHCFRQAVRWFYNLQSERCEPFMYGGCGGNGNRFRTYEECSQTCPNLPTDRCRHPIVTGHCRARFIRWAYQEDTRECVEFVYGGCGANGNNFRTRQECGYTCQDREEQKQTCLCVKQKLKPSFCKNDFVISGRVRQEISSSVNGALLVVEIDEIFKLPERMMVRSGVLTGNITMLRDMSRTPRGCHCIQFSSDGLIIFMGTMNEHYEAVIDDSSYVIASNTKRKSKLAMLKSSLLRCPGGEENRNRVLLARDNTEPGRNRRPEKLQAIRHVEREIHAATMFQPMDALPVYPRKPMRKSRSKVKNLMI
ncbi:WAP, Kazal, immunoglobulin, Kunitz and NTR domain-containing protein 2 [Holothuria leucospilota]|uniref:WAP, Kazal, immunoglobulin, Kunitz and NTR domain-containing protein 2 n=1 Tax=Holothuria leucospilota TaxID=206669 RepID=A0A9Q1HJG4_HOLLE|nr:WAP, Kazal, immunoglobulin, Kunitz and NTR domain-containing protein 2 [Holothuria leucospilota]